MTLCLEITKRLVITYWIARGQRRAITRFTPGSWDQTDFYQVETAEYVLKHEWAQKCQAFSIAVQGPDGYDAAPTFRVYEGDGTYVAWYTNVKLPPPHKWHFRRHHRHL